jgi:mono/diheme cytochrome c family protein
MKRITNRSRARPMALALALPALAAIALPALAAGGPDASAKSDAAAVERGRYLVSTSACHDCHTPWKMGPKGPEPDMGRMLSGHPQDFAVPPPPKLQAPWIAAFAETNTAWAGPWGVSFTANLTPDKDTGLGKWTLRNFTETIRTGRHMGRGRPVLPPMPIPVYRNFNDADLAAIYAYLQSIPPIANRVPEPLPAAATVAGN